MVYKAFHIQTFPARPLQTASLPIVRPSFGASLAGVILALALLPGGPVQAQAPKPAVQATPSPVPTAAVPAPKVEAAPQAVPGFWDPRRRPERPDLSRI